jgi:imidazoleglycerol phosphate synthase, cyclase subunit
MITKRIIPCLDVKDGRVVKGTNFINLRDAGDPVECAKLYSEQGADEIVFLDITASNEERKTIIDVVKRTAAEVFMPLTVGGGIASIDDIREVLRAGADKVGINSAAVKRKELIAEAAEVFGRQCIVLAIDARKTDNGKSGYSVYINGGRIDAGIDALEWALESESLGAGEILLTSMDEDGRKNGYDIELTKMIAENVSIPVIASGGCGSLEHFKEVFEKTEASAALAASLFHFRELSVPEVKKYLADNGFEMRL